MLPNLYSATFTKTQISQLPPTLPYTTSPQPFLTQLSPTLPYTTFPNSSLHNFPQPFLTQLYQTRARYPHPTHLANFTQPFFAQIHPTFIHSFIHSFIHTNTSSVRLRLAHVVSTVSNAKFLLPIALLKVLVIILGNNNPPKSI